VKITITQASTRLDREGGPLFTIGYPHLDKLIEGMKKGHLYLFYGDMQIVDDLVHKIIVRGCSEGEVAYLNNTNYYSEKTLLNVDKLAYHAKEEGVDPLPLLGQVYFAAAYNELRQPKAAKILGEKIREKDSTKLLMIHGITRFFEDAKDRLQVIENLNRSLSHLWHLAVEKNLVMIVTTDTTDTNRMELPKPQGTNLMLHLANVIVFFRESKQKRMVEAVLIKHPEKKTPLRISNIFPAPVRDILDSPRRIPQTLLNKLEKNHYDVVGDPCYREACRLLLHEVHEGNQVPSRTVNFPSVLDALNFSANIHNKSDIEALKEAMRKHEAMIRVLKEKIEEMIDEGGS
jgi:hypothetical protein